MAAATSVTGPSQANHVGDHFSKMWRVNGTLDAANLIDAAGTTDTFTLTGTGADFALGDAVVAFSCSVDLAGLTVTPYVSATGVVSVRIQNESTGAVDLASATWKFLVGRFAF